MRTNKAHSSNRTKAALFMLLFCISHRILAQQQRELHTGWKCIKASAVSKTGEEISQANYLLKDWMPATVPGTVLTSLLNNGKVPDPFYGMNNEQILDIYTTGKDLYTYWFATDITETYPQADEKVWLQFRGVNNSCDIYLNGHKVNTTRKSMFLRQQYDITPFLAKNGKNRLAVLVHPPDEPGNANGGQGGDGTIAKNITNQYVAGWDWIQPVRDRNTGIWDKVIIKRTKQVTVSNTRVVTLVPGIRHVDGPQTPATIKVSADVVNTSDRVVEGTLQYTLEDTTVIFRIQLEPHIKNEIALPDLILKDPKLWWPNGYGRVNLYKLKVRFLADHKTISDEEEVTFGVRQISSAWNTTTNSREVRVNGQKIFIKGANWILSDAMLRLSKERYEAEVRYHHDMNVNMIRVWGGGITERPEFYDACDKYGILVMQDFWMSGDCNGRWFDSFKRDDTTARRKYPDDHRLYIASLADQIDMLRNHPSLAIWCGGNEIKPPADILKCLRDTLLPDRDNTRIFFAYSNDDSMSYHSGDGPYTIQTNNYFWEHRSFPFNSEIGSVGIGDYESLERFLPKEHMQAPEFDTVTKSWKADSVWQYHRYMGYDSAIEAYGHPADVVDFTKKAQLVNYNQYRTLMESFTAHMWDWYTGVMVWKTQNPWTAMRGQMYDVYLDPNACMYGLAEGNKPIHIMYDPINRTAKIANSTEYGKKVRMSAKAYLMDGQESDIMGKYVQAPSQTCEDYFDFKNTVKVLSRDNGVFLLLGLTDTLGNVLHENFYWLPNKDGKYPGLADMPRASIGVTARHTTKRIIQVDITNPFGNPVAFFNRISLVDARTKKRILPAFYNNNYISVVPGQLQTIQIEFDPQEGVKPLIEINGWNTGKQFIDVK